MIQLKGDRLDQSFGGTPEMLVRWYRRGVAGLQRSAASSNGVAVPSLWPILLVQHPCARIYKHCIRLRDYLLPRLLV
jgi:hypothetical protein